MNTCRYPGMQIAKKKSFTSEEVLGIDLLTLYWDVHFNSFIFFVKKNMTTKHVIIDEYTN